ncbi:MAG: hypothetical protein HY650_13550 [Acidobacteria bacterium]|nr:hypothetical protein [Acidobacteriota bacterium]
MTEESTVVDRLQQLMEKIQSLHDAYVDAARAKEQQKVKECLTELRQIGKEITELIDKLE